MGPRSWPACYRPSASEALASCPCWWLWRAILCAHVGPRGPTNIPQHSLVLSTVASPQWLTLTADSSDYMRFTAFGSKKVRLISEIKTNYNKRQIYYLYLPQVYSLKGRLSRTSPLLTQYSAQNSWRTWWCPKVLCIYSKNVIIYWVLG